MKKVTTITLLFTLILSPVSANFGVVPLDTDVKTDSGSKKFQIGLLNMGSETLEIKLSTRNLSNGEVNFEDKEFELEPSRVSSNPSGSGWYYIGGRYVQLKYVDFQYTASNKQGTEKFYLEVNAERLGIQEGFSSNIAQVREVPYTIVMSQEGIKGDNWSGEKEPGREENIQDTINNSENTDSPVNTSDSSNLLDGNQNSTEKTPKAARDYNYVTFILLLTILFILSYIFYEI